MTPLKLNSENVGISNIRNLYSLYGVYIYVDGNPIYGSGQPYIYSDVTLPYLTLKKNSKTGGAGCGAGCFPCFVRGSIWESNCQKAAITNCMNCEKIRAKQITEETTHLSFSFPAPSSCRPCHSRPCCPWASRHLWAHHTCTWHISYSLCCCIWTSTGKNKSKKHKGL